VPLLQVLRCGSGINYLLIFARRKPPVPVPRLPPDNVEQLIMAEALVSSSSIITLLQIKIQGVIDDIQQIRAPSEALEVEKAAIEFRLSSVHSVLSALKDKEEQTEWVATMKSLGTPNGPFHQVGFVVDALAAKFATPKRSSMRSTWPFRKDEIIALASRIEQQESLLGLALQNDAAYVPNTTFMSYSKIVDVYLPLSAMKYWPSSGTCSTCKWDERVNSKTMGDANAFCQSQKKNCIRRTKKFYSGSPH
jgi:hypothetical protein